MALPLAFLTTAFDVFGTVKYALLLLAALAALGWLAWSMAAGRGIRVPGGWAGLLLAAFLVWLALATSFSPIKLISLFGLRKRLLGLVTYLAAAALLTAAANVTWDKQKLRAFSYSVGGVAVISSLVGVAQFLGSTFPLDLKEQFGRAAYSTFGNPVYFGAFLALILPVLLYLVLDGRSPQDRLVGYVSLPIALAGLAATFSSGAALGAIVGGGIFLIGRYVRRNPEHLKYIAVAVLLIVVVAPILILATKAENVSIGRRLWIWSAAARVTADQPLFGTGLENLSSGIARLGIVPENEALYSGTYQDAHNNWLNLASTAGLPAAGLWLAFVVVALTRAVRARRAEPAEYSVLLALWAGIIGYLATVQFNPEDIGSLPLLYIWLGMVLSLSGQVKEIRLKTSPVLTAAAGGLILALIGAVYLPVNAVLAETGLLKANNPPDIESAIAAYEDVQGRQPWQSEYYTLEVYRLLPSLQSLDSRLGVELLEAARTGVKVNPADPEARLALGHIYRAGATLQNDSRLYRQALSIYEQVLEMDRYNPKAIRFVALTYHDIGELGGRL